MIDREVATLEVAPHPDRAAHAERWFTGPVIIAAVASVPAMFLSTMGSPADRIGTGVNVAILAVFVAESVVLLALSRDRVAWVRQHRFVLGVTLATIPAVIFAVGPVQVLRLLRVVRVVGALRILRVRRILKAGRVLRERAGLTGWAWRATFLLLSLTSAAFVALVLADPSSTSRRAIDEAVGRLGILAVLVAGAILATATYIVARTRRTSPPSTSTSTDASR